MAKSSELFEALLETLRPAMPAGVSHDLCVSTVREQLADESASITAQQIIAAERTNQKVTDAPESDLWDALVESLCETLQSAAVGTVSGDANTARTLFVARLKVIAEEANRRWLIAVPVNVDLHMGAASELSTVNTQRVVIAACETQVQLETQIENACRVIGVPAPAKGALTLPLPTQPLFVALTQGAPEPAYRKGMRSFYVGRDGLRFVEYAHDPQKDLGPVNIGDVYEPLLESWLIEVDGREVKRKTLLQVDVSLGAIELERNPKKFELYDASARVMEMYPEDASTKLQKSLGGRLARSIRIFSRAVVQTNCDLRFFLILVAFEALLNRKDSPIAEALAEYGALLTADGVEERSLLARELKSAYDARSRFVHDGQIPSEQLGEEKFAQVETLVFRTWAGTVRALLPQGEAGWSDDVFFEKLVKLKFGATWKEVAETR
jgi:Apea-like HEPN